MVVVAEKLKCWQLVVCEWSAKWWMAECRGVLDGPVWCEWSGSLGHKCRLVYSGMYRGWMRSAGAAAVEAGNVASKTAAIERPSQSSERYWCAQSGGSEF